MYVCIKKHPNAESKHFIVERSLLQNQQTFYK